MITIQTSVGALYYRVSGEGVPSRYKLFPLLVSQIMAVSFRGHGRFFVEGVFVLGVGVGGLSIRVFVNPLVCKCTAAFGCKFLARV